MLTEKPDFLIVKANLIILERRLLSAELEIRPLSSKEICA